MKAADLRKAILQAAVQGKLVPQDKNDEPASELLKRVQAEKAMLIKDGKLKKEKPLQPITEEIPYDLPDGWIWCRLNDILCFIDYRGKTPNKITQGIPLITAANIKKGNMDYSKKWYISDVEFADRQSRGVAQRGDILFTTEAPLGNVALADLDVFSTGQRIIALRSLDEMFSNRLYMYFLLSPQMQTQIFEKRSGMTASGIKAALFKTILIPLVPVEEQQRIVRKIDELMAMCDELEAAEKQLDALESHFFDYLPKSILQAAVQGKLVPQDKNDEPASELLKQIQTEKAVLIKEGKLKKEKPLPPITEDEIPYDLPDGWVWCRLGELCNYGNTQNAKPNDIPLGSWILELEDIEKDTGQIIAKRTSPERKPQSTKHVFKSGNLLYSKLRPYLNKVLIADADGYSTSEILPLHFSKDISVDYMLRFFRSPAFVEYANKCSYGVKMPRLGTNDGKMALVPLPPFAEQRRIVAKVDELMAMCDELKRVTEQPINYDNVIPFPVEPKENIEPIAMAARGKVEGMSDQAKQAIEDLFGEDE